MKEKFDLDAWLEVYQDFVYVSILFEMKRKMRDAYSKEIIGYLGILSLNIFSHELIISNLIPKEAFPQNICTLLRKYRQRFLKQLPYENSKLLNKIITDMGIDFHDYVFDIILLVDKKSRSKLFAINFCSWDINHLTIDEMQTFEDVLVMFDTVIEIFISSLGLDKTKMMDELDESISMAAVVVENNLQLEKMSYSSSKLFSSSKINDQDKFIVLYYYGMIYTAYHIEMLMPINLSLSSNVFNIDISKTSRKIKALVIETFYLASQRIHSDFLNSVNVEINSAIPDLSFYPLNRKLRNNLHYGSPTRLTALEYDMVQHYQDIYLAKVLQEFNKNIEFSFGSDYEHDKWLAHLNPI